LLETSSRPQPGSQAWPCP